MKKIILSVLFFSLLTTGSAFAAKKFGSAGCGLGSMIFTENKPVSQVFAATTNGTSYSQTFGITSGTSNCTDDGAVAANHQVPFFIEVNRVSLARDIARGSGETLTSFSGLIHCSNPEMLGAALQKNYSRIFAAENSSAGQVADSISDVVSADAALSSCQI